MSTFQPQQLDRGQSVRRKAGTNAHHIHLTNCTTKLHSRFHEGRKIVCNNFQRATQERVIEMAIYAKQALPLVRTRILRLLHISPMAARSPARRPRDNRAMSGKIAGKMSCGIATQLPGNSRATAAAMPPDGRADDSQDNLLCAAQQPRRNPCNGQDSILQDDSPEIPAFNHDIQKL
jgi:hypothetical protein